jgi:hypothetical protein
MEAYKNSCEQAGGRFETFTGSLFCKGIGEFTRDNTRTYSNAGECFAPGDCDYYTSAREWLIDFNFVWEYDCGSHREGSGGSLPSALGMSNPGGKAPPSSHPYIAFGVVLFCVLLLGITVIIHRMYTNRRHQWTPASTSEMELHDLDLGSKPKEALGPLPKIS